MITDLSYEAFCRKYYEKTKEWADINMADYIKTYGPLPPSIDTELVKDICVVYALQKAYHTYNSTNESKASLKTYISTILKNQIKTEVGKAFTSTGTKSRVSLDRDFKRSSDSKSDITPELDGKLKVRVHAEPKNTNLKSVSDSPLIDPSCEEYSNHEILSSLIKRLSREDQIILDCWLIDPKTYAEDSLKELGWEQNQRGLVQKRKERAIAALKRMKEESASKEEPNNEYVEEEEQPENDTKQIYEYSLRLSEMKPYVEIIKEYFGLNHPNLDMELLLLDDDPEREFNLIAFVPYDDIKKALLDASFNVGEDIEEYTSLLWTVANLYYGDMYQRYEEAAMEEADDYLRWNCIQEDITRLFAFMGKHKSEEHINIKVGNDSVELDNPFRWFQSLLDNHLFPNCIPDIKDIKQANQILAKAKGRKVDNKVATAIVNGVATYFKEKGLITARAPKNLCSFLWKFLVMMKLKDASDYLFTESSIKNWINNIQGQKDDPKIYTPEIREISIEELKEIPLNERAERWLFNPE